MADKSLFLQGTFIRNEIVEGNRKSDGKPFKMNVAVIRWLCNDEQTREIIPVDVQPHRGDILEFEPLSYGNGSRLQLVRGDF